MDEAGRIIENASHGDARAIDALLVRYLPQLAAYLRSHAGGVVTAKESRSDLVQSVCREVLKQLALGGLTFRGESAFKHWLFEAALLKVKERARFWRAEKRDPVRERSTGGPRKTGSSERSAAQDRFLLTLVTPSRVADANEQLDRARAAFQSLTPDQREIIVLARIEQLPHARIAERLGKDEAHCRVLLSRALARLGTLLAKR